MLYLIRPDGQMAWNNLPSKTLDAATEHGADLSRLDWLPADRRADETTVALALRHGTACALGIVLGGGHVEMAHRAAHIAQTHQDASHSRAAAQQQGGDLMEHLTPGWTEHGHQLDAGVEQAAGRAVEEALEEVREALAKDVDPRLVNHWTRLGGHVPELRLH